MLPSEPRSFAAFVAAVVDLLNELEIPYAVAGSVASGLYGEPRTTLDVDLTLRIALGQVAAFAEAAGNIDLTVDDVAVRERLRDPHPQPFNVIDPRGGWKADCYLLRDEEYDRSAFARRREIRFDATSSTQLWVYAPEDVILYKLVYYKMSNGVSVKHLRDIAGMLLNLDRSNLPFDRDYMVLWAGQLSVLKTWQRLDDESKQA